MANAIHDALIRESANRAPSPNARILLIDDTPEIAELLTFALRDRGYDVVVDRLRHRHQRARRSEHQADAVVLDCSVYEMSESLFDTVRGDPRHADAAGRHRQRHTGKSRRQPARARDAEHVLLIPKPFTGAQVARALDELLSSRPSASP